MTDQAEVSLTGVVEFICNELNNILPEPATAPLTAETDMTEDINVDSLGVMNLVFALEEKYDIAIPLNALSDIRKINELAELILKVHSER